MENQGNNFSSLDPDDWEKSRELMHQMVDDAIDYLQNIRTSKIWQKMPPDVLESFKSSLPKEPETAEEVYADFTHNILPYPMGNVHPRFWAWYMGSGLWSGVVGDFWASMMNPNLGGGNHAAHKVEEQVINWMKEIMDFPESSSGLLVSGGSMANFVALAVARNLKAGYDVRKEGVKDSTKFRFYGSTEVHSCNQKAIELLGLGSDALIKIPVNENYSMNVNLLEKQIKEDKQKGLLPVAVIASSGTVNTGAIDDLNTIADICVKEGLWFHVDGAIGAIARLSKLGRPLLDGISRADSVALDLHKWMHMPFEAGCVLVRDEAAHKSTFSLIPEYLTKNTRGVASGSNWFSEYGLQLSRRFRALKIWMSLKEHGSDKFGEMIDRNIRQAAYLEKLVRENQLLEMMAPVGLDIVCFRYNPGSFETEELNALNKEIKLQIEERGIALPGYTTLKGAFCLRIAISNHRTTYEDFDLLVESVLNIGAEIKS